MQSSLKAARLKNWGATYSSHTATAVPKFTPKELNTTLTAETHLQCGPNYVLPRANALTDLDRQNWNITGDDFTIFYRNADELMDAFVTELENKHTKQRSKHL